MFWSSADQTSAFFVIFKNQNLKNMNKIDVPDSWLLPQYRLAQKVKQGVIIGMTYHPPDTQRAFELGEGWLYTVLLNEFSEDIEIIPFERLWEIVINNL